MSTPFPQADTLCMQRLQGLLEGLARRVTSIKQKFNARNTLYFSEAANEVSQCILLALREEGPKAVESAIQGFEITGRRFDADLEKDLMDTFEACFSRVYEELVRLHGTEMAYFRRSIQNQTFIPSDEAVLAAGKQVQTAAQAAVRAYVGHLKRSQKRWWEQLAPVAAIARSVFGLFGKGS